MDELINGGYSELLGEIKTRIRTAQYDALRAVNKELISLYWNIGKLIVEKQKGILGDLRLSKNWRPIYETSSLASEAFQPETSGTCAICTLLTAIVKNCNHWLQKLAGAIMSRYLRSARMIWSANFIFV